MTDGECNMPGPGQAHCTEHWRHRYSCYDASLGVSFNGLQAWVHDHLGCADSGYINEEH